MTWMNEYDVEQAVARFSGNPETPNLGYASEVLVRLVGWTNSNSDGWPYWRKPAKAASRLMEALQQASGEYFRGARVTDLPDADLKRALTPVKSFLTRENVPHPEVL